MFGDTTMTACERCGDTIFNYEINGRICTACSNAVSAANKEEKMISVNFHGWRMAACMMVRVHEERILDTLADARRCDLRAAYFKYRGTNYCVNLDNGTVTTQ